MTKKTVCFLLLFLFCEAFFSRPFLARTLLEETPHENLSLPPPSIQDEEFVRRSERASRFVFSDLPRHLGYDLKESFWGLGALGLGVGIGITGIFYSQDKKIESSFAPHALFGETGDKVISHLGAPYTMAGVGFLTTMIGAKAHHKKLRTTGEAMLESLFWTELITFGLKYAFNRDRPDGSSRGFPSAHASGVFSTATVLEVMYGPKVGIPAYAAAALVSLARVDGYHHFPSDVIMGATLGSVIGYGTARFHKKLHHSFTLMPDIRPDHYGMMIYQAF